MAAPLDHDHLADRLADELAEHDPGRRPDAELPTLNRPQAAEALGMSTDTLDRLVVAGLIAYHQIGARKKFSRADLGRYLASTRQEAGR